MKRIFIFLFVISLTFLSFADSFTDLILKKKNDFYIQQARIYSSRNDFNNAEKYYMKVINSSLKDDTVEISYKELFDMMVSTSRDSQAMELKKKYLSVFPHGKYFESQNNNENVSHQKQENEEKSSWIRFRNGLFGFFRKIQTVSEKVVGAQVYAAVRLTRPLSNNRLYTERVKKIGKAVAAKSPRQDVKYRFYVIKDDSLNAFAVPGGYIFVNEGTVKATLNDDSALAGVLGHEIGHITSRHSIHSLEKSLLFQRILDISKSKTIDKYKRALQISYIFFYQLPISRENEYQADYWGVSLSYAAGYDPNGLIRFFELLKKKYGTKESKGSTLLSTHPATNDRIKHAKNIIKGLAPRASI